jgi:hypothetical protein
MGVQGNFFRAKQKAPPSLTGLSELVQADQDLAAPAGLADHAFELRDPNLGIELIAADSPDSFVDDTPTAVMVRQILGAVAQFEKAALVAKLKGARERVRRQRGKCEGRKAHRETNPEAVVMAKRLHRASPKTGERMSLRRISAELKAAGYLNERGREFNPNSIRSMVSGPQPRSAGSPI